MAERLSGLIMGEYGRMRDCLQALLVSIPQIDHVYQADDLEQLSGYLSQEQISFVLIDSNVPQDQLVRLLDALKAQPRPIKSLVIVGTSAEERLSRQAGADEVLLRGSSAVAFIEALCRVVPLESLKERLSMCTESASEEELKSFI